ncbi:MAG: DNA internalization-related competence protein ComEC/Rec2 [Bacillus sp. (in: Bacteria)]|nr:DNA internalization-related competence protein ComEC/Rec2 [Bacillus sp. (in: firmicutes)]MCM1426892.1 DNA internalization-related competence protein ComEC/Rec2 [Eubacterium sp.]
MPHLRRNDRLRERNNMRRPVCLIGLAFVLMLWIYLCINPIPETSFGEDCRHTVVLTGQVDKKEYRISKEREVPVIYLKNVQILNSQTENAQFMEKEQTPMLSQIEGVICYMEEEKGAAPKIGSYVRMQGRLRGFSQATNPGEFNSRRYYQILHIQARLQNAQLLQESVSYHKFGEKLWQIRTYLASLLDASYEKDDAALMKAMLLGEKSGLDEEIKQLYQVNGIIHILSISGLHISLIGMGFYKILRKLGCPRLVTTLLAIGFMYSYGLMTGMSISALRAVVMFAFRIMAELLKRTYDMLTAMTIVAVSVLIEQPLYLYHSGFLFSFGAILAIGLFLPIVEENLLGKTKLERVMSTSLSVAIITLPVYLCFYYEYPLYSLFLNLLIIPGTGLIVADGLITIAAAAYCLPLGKYPAFPAHLMFSFYEYCCKLTLKLPGSRNIMGKPENWQVILFIIIITLAIFAGKKWSRLQFWQWILIALMCITMRWQEGLQITLIDVGQGDGIYIADGMGGHYLIDGGSSDKSDTGTYQILPFLKYEGVDTLDAVFVTHMDSDHYNGIQTLIEQMDTSGVIIKNLILPDIGEESKSEAYKELARSAARQKISVRYLHKGDMICHGKLRLTCLHPESGSNRETNEASIVLYLEYDEFTALFTGDLEGSGEESVRKQLENYLPAGKNLTMLKVAHHGSKNSTEAAFLETASPYIALISAGKDNSYGHPHEELIKRLTQAGSRIYQTNEGGALTVTYRRHRLNVECFRGVPSDNRHF